MNTPNLNSTFWRKCAVMDELLSQGNQVMAAHSESTMNKLLSLVEGLDDNLRESPTSKPIKKFLYPNSGKGSSNSTADNSFNSSDQKA